MFLTAIVTLDISFPGWQATLVGFGSLDDVRTEPLESVVGFVAALTNVVMLASPWAVLRPQSPISRGLPLATVFAIFVHAVFAVFRDRALLLGPGYFVWVASFLVVAAGLYLARSRELGQARGAPQP
jgi:hypothetical protein